jgi:tetratricopeptide (TPR) repeat protein
LIRSLALLPLAATGGSDAALAAEGLADELARHLARVRSVRVLGAASNARVLGDARDVRQIADTLQVDAVLTGDVRSTRDGIEAALQLVDGPSGATLWKGSYRGPLEPTGTSPGAAASLLGDLFRQVWPGEPAPAAPVQSPQAYFAYLRGRSQLAKRNAEALRAAAAEFARTIALEPRFAEAHAGLADAYLLMGIFGALDPAVAFPKAKESARAALALNAQSADAHTSLAFATELLDHDWPAAEAHFRAAIAANPSHASAHHWYALLLDSMLRGDEAIREMETARALAPLSVNINSDLGMVLAHQGRAADAIAQFARTLAIDPSYVDAHSELGWAYREAGEYDRAIDSFRRAGELGAHPAQVAVNVLVCHARAGRHEQVRQILKRLQTPGTFAAPVPPALLAQALIAAGDHDRGLDLLLADPFAADVNLLVGTIYRPLWNDPRFEALVRRNGLLEPFTAYKRAQRGALRLPPDRAAAQ